jgi:predicted naringenin-chalcone synthase
MLRSGHARARRPPGVSGSNAQLADEACSLGVSSGKEGLVRCMTATAYINRISTAVPAHDIHDRFVDFVSTRLLEGSTAGAFARMARRSGIDHRYSVLPPAPSSDTTAIDAHGFYTVGAFPNIGARMQLFEKSAPNLALAAIEKLEIAKPSSITHLIITCCTGFAAPGLDFEIIDRCGLPHNVERTSIGFMGCYAAVNGLKVARHIIRSDPGAVVLVVNLELCTLHLQDTTDLAPWLSSLLFADGCAAALVSAQAEGIEIEGFDILTIPNTRDFLTWAVRDQSFEMHLSGQLPAALEAALAGEASLQADHRHRLLAVHPGGRTILDAVVNGLALDSCALDVSRGVLRDFGNLSSATLMFVLARIVEGRNRGRAGLAMSFGPGVVAELMRFNVV